MVTAARNAPQHSRWILSPVWDWILFIGSPLLVIAAIVPLRGVFRSESISLFLLAFFTFGHHLPGFFRAYGDRDLFARYRWRFLLAPPVVFTAALCFSTHNLHGLLLAVFAWDIWHVLMQQYGFLRIYDAKSGSIAPLTARLDQVLALSWYVTFILLSPYYRHDLFLRAWQSGVPLLSPPILSGLAWLGVAASGAITVAWLVHHYRLPAKPDRRKLAALAIFLAATLYLYVILDDFVVGFAVWSAFHCVQYYGIVWAFNVRRARSSPNAGAFLRFLFRPRLALLLLYAVAIGTYGAINYFQGDTREGIINRLLAAFIITSGTLHYYYDGFMWKVRDADTRRIFDIAVSSPTARLRPLPGALHLVIFAAVCAALAWLESAQPNDPLAVRTALAGATPHSASAQFHAALQYARAGRRPEAIAAFERTVALDPLRREAHYNLALLLASSSPDIALAHLGQATGGNEDEMFARLEREPDAASLVSNLGLGLLARNDRDAARRMFERALQRDPAHPHAAINLAHLLFFDRRFAEALSLYQRVVNRDPGNLLARVSLGHTLLALNRPQEARLHFEASVASSDPQVRRAAEKGLASIR